jgi:eukaryotic-like serine/threonine-protein kinase
MGPRDDHPQDDPLDHLALAFDQALASGNQLEATPVPPDLQLKWQSLKQCLLRLEKDRLHVPPTTVKPADQSSLPGYVDLDWTIDAHQQIGRFQLLRELGRGGHGVVFLAHDSTLRRNVALKLPRPEMLTTAELRQRFRREAEAAARLEHPNLVSVLEAGELGPVCYLISTYCPGPTLAAYLKQQPGAIPVRDAAKLVAALADGVAYMHANGVLHRDIKPGNVLLQGDQKGIIDLRTAIPKLTDFGLAKFTDVVTHHTRTGTIMGTPAYMSPEQADGRVSAIGPATDVYALGVMLYEVLVGRPPFVGASDMDTARQILVDQPVPQRRLRPDVPRDLETICLKCLEKAPHRRYATVAALATDLQAFLNGELIKARPAGPLERVVKWARRRPALAASSGVSAVALVGLTAWAGWYSVEVGRHNVSLQNALKRAEAGERRLLEENYALQISQAGTMQTNDPAGLLGDLLLRLRPQPDQDDLRGFEWNYLWGLARHDLRLRGHRTGVSAVAVSPNGQICASGDANGIVRLWKVDTGEPLAELIGHTARIGSIKFSRDGRYLVTGAGNPNPRVTPTNKGELIIWDVAGKELARLGKDGTLNVDYVAVDAEFRTIAFAGCNSTDPANGGSDQWIVSLWDWQTGRVSCLSHENEPLVRDLQVAPDGFTLAIGRYPSEVHFWDLRNRNLVRTLACDRQKDMLCIAYSPDGNFLATGNRFGNVDFWNLIQFKWHGGRAVPRAKADKVAFDHSGNRIAALASVKDEPTIKSVLRMWDWPAGTLRPEEFKSDFPLGDFAFSPNGQVVALASKENHVHLWRPYAEDMVSTLKVSGKKEAWGIAFSPDSKTLAVGYDDEAGNDQETLKLWDVATCRELVNLRGHATMISSVAFAPDGTLYSVGYDNLVKAWDAGSHEVVADFKGHTQPIKTLACSPNGRTMASAGHDGRVKLWDAATGRETFTLSSHTDRYEAVVFAPSGEALAAGGNNGELRIWDVATGQEIREIKDTVHIFALAYSPNGQVLASANKDGAIKLHDLSGSGAPRILIGHTGEARTVAFSPDGKTLASGGEDRTVRLWQVSTGRELLVFKDLPQRVNRIAFSPDGQHLAAALHDGSVKIWHAGGRE